MCPSKQLVGESGEVAPRDTYWSAGSLKKISCAYTVWYGRVGTELDLVQCVLRFEMIG